ncbi:MAG: ATP cone domain-containing protein [Myxococcota bacterium]
MASHPLVVVGPDGPRPFMRGILVQSLVSRGVPFEVALATATEIRDRVSDKESVELSELSKLVEELLADHVDLEKLPLRPAREPPLVRGPRGTQTPFSKGMLAVSLQGAGLDPSDAYDVARELEARLLRERPRFIDRGELRDRVSETIERTHGVRAAERYRVWRQALEDGRPIFLLIGGSTGVGKTSIAVEVARRLEISRVVGTDSIRQIMRLMFSPDLMPEIHCSTYDAHEVLMPERGNDPEAVIAAFREQAQKIAVGVHALLDRAVEENTSMMIEGVNLVPGMLELERYHPHAHVIFLVVATLDHEAYRRRFPERAETARDRAAERYLEHLDAILAIQDQVLAEAEHCGLPIIDNVRLDEAVLSVTRSVLSTLKKSLPLGMRTDGA